MFTLAALAFATSPETAAVIEDYPYGFRLRCMMRVWIEFRKGNGFRYCTQTTNPKKAGIVWNAPKKGTYSRVSMAISQDENGHLSPVSLTEYSGLPEYDAFMEQHGDALSEHARGSFRYYYDVKKAYTKKEAELGVSNIYDATPEQRTEIKRAAWHAMNTHVQAGTDY